MGECRHQERRRQSRWRGAAAYARLLERTRVRGSQAVTGAATFPHRAAQSQEPAPHLARPPGSSPHRRTCCRDASPLERLGQSPLRPDRALGRGLRPATPASRAGVTRGPSLSSSSFVGSGSHGGRMIPLHILVLAPQPFFQPRGTPIAVRNLVEQLAADGHRLDLLVYPEGEDVAIPNCTVHRVPKLPGLAGFARVLGEEARGRRPARGQGAPDNAEERPDVVHAVEESAFIAMFARRMYGVPTSMTWTRPSRSSSWSSSRCSRCCGRCCVRCERAVVRASMGTVVVCRALEDIARSMRPAHLVARVEDSSLLQDGLSIVREPLPRPRDAVRSPCTSATWSGTRESICCWRDSARPQGGADRATRAGGRDSRTIAAVPRPRGELGIAGNVHFLGPGR